MDVIWKVFFSSGYIFKMLLFSAVFLSAACLHGVFWSRALKIRAHWAQLPGIGLVSILALEELLCWPVVAFRLSSGLLMGLTAAVLLIPAAAALCLRSPADPVTGEKTARADRLLAAAVIILVTAAALYSAFEYRANNDDSLYVSNIALFAVSDRINPYDASMGDVTTRSIPMYDFQVWEALLSVPCRLFGLGAAETAHTLIVIPLILCSASAFFSLGRALTGTARKAWLFLAVMTVFHLGCRSIAYSEGVFLLGRAWQGKSVNLGVTLPVLSAMVTEHFRQPAGGKGRPAVIVWLCVLSGMAMNATSLYIDGFQLLFLSAAWALMEKRFRKALPMLPGAAIALVFTALIYFRVSEGAGIVENASAAGPAFFAETLNSFFGKMKVFLVMYFGALIYIAARKEKTAGTYFLLTGAMMLVFLWNPLSGRFVAEKITKTPTYWRVFWLVPVGPAIAWCVADLTGRLSGRRAAALGLAMLCLTAYAGTWETQDYVPAENVEKIRPKILEMGDRIVSEGISGPVLACNSVSTTLRQVHTDLRLLVAKEGFIRDVYDAWGREEEGNDLRYLYGFANASLSSEECAAAGALLDRYQVGCVILRVGNKAGLDTMKSLKWRLLDKGDGFMMYVRPR
ncbi:MAG: hypothetical protein IJR97_11440 [Clostridia bacterium]|nr:hypothetical protein [Clostridia bacterium]